MSKYFSQLPDFEYVSRLPDARISDYIKVKNLFKKGTLRDDIFQDLTVFDKYQIVGDDRPDNVAFKFYGDSNLDWLVLTCNNIINVQTEWPLKQSDFDRFMLDKYGDYDTLYNGVHHYETVEVKNKEGVVVVPEGLQVASDYSVNFYDIFDDQPVTVSNTESKTFEVSVVATDDGNRYYIDGVRQPILKLLRGATYTFSQSNSSNEGHPLRLSATSNGTHATGGEEYVSGVTTLGTPGSFGSYTRIEVPLDAPDNLYYYCSNHSNMGSSAEVVYSLKKSTTAITNYTYEERIENEKRSIFLLKPRFLTIVRDDLQEMMQYEKGSTQYVSGTLKRADNIRLYQ
jgi:hypothetical protein|tara:strand:- start:55 stop:1080 length:1026 start_codon:yes stop_codon:yes gene_type:complete